MKNKFTWLFAFLCISMMSWAIDWGSYEWLGNGGVDTKYNSKIKATVTPELTGGANGFINNLQPKSGYDCIHIAMPSAAFGEFSLDEADYTLEGAGFFPHLNAFTKRETEFTVVCNSVTYTFTIYYADGKEVEEVYDTNLALASQGSSATASSGTANLAIDGNEGTRWESAQTDDETWTLDMGQKRIFNTIKILWEGAYCTQYALTYSNDGENWSDLYTETNLTQDGWQTIELEEDVIARYIKYHGTQRATQYGQSFYEFQVLLPNTSVLTSINLTAAATLKKIGEGVALTAQAKDQNNSNMEAEISWEITPAGVGHVTDGIYYPDLAGNATIRAYSGEIYSSSVSILGVSSDNLALNHLLSHSEEYINNETGLVENGAANAVDGNTGSVWQGSVTNGTADDEASRTYSSWIIVDLGANYDIEAITIQFEGACAQDYHVDFSANNTDWTIGYNHEGNASIHGRTDVLTTQLANNTNVRYVKFESTKAATQWGMKIFEFQVFGTESASPTKAVSASVNDPAMGTATVKQNDIAVTEVENGTEVTFSAVANDGYIFVNWSNGNTNPTFNATVDAAMNLTANFRALGTIYCNTEMTTDNHTIYVTMKRSDENEYTLIVRSADEMTNFGGTVIYRPENIMVEDIRNQGVLSDGNHTLTVTMESEGEPYFGTPLYVIFAGIGERTYSQTQSVHPEYAVACDDAVAVTGVTLSQSSANMLLGNTLTLTPTFTPAYATDRALTWVSSDTDVATVDNGVVTPVAEGSATITARLTSNNAIYATCTVTVVTSLAAATWYGYGVITPQEGLTGITYSVTRNADQTLTFTMTTDKNIVGYVSGIDGDVHGSFGGYTAQTHQGTFTTEETFAENTALNCRLTFASVAYGATPIPFTYYVGSSNAALPQAVAVDEQKDNTTVLNSYDGQDVIGILGRSFVADGGNYTLVLPFDVSAEQTAEQLPGKLTQLTGIYKKTNGDIYLNFSPATDIEAGVAYLYEPSVDVTNPIFTNVTLDKDIHAPEYTADNVSAQFVGMYAPTEDARQLNTNAYVLGSENWLYRANDYSVAVPMSALRAYFVLDFAGASPASARIVFGEQVYTDIAETDALPATTKTIENGQLIILHDGMRYNAQGQLIK